MLSGGGTHILSSEGKGGTHILPNTNLKKTEIAQIKL